MPDKDTDKKKPDAGEKNMAAALSGDTDLHGENSDLIDALGGESDGDLDDFTASPADRGDFLEDPKPAEEEEAEEEEETPAEEEEAEEEEAEEEEETPAEKEEAEGEEETPAEEEETEEEEETPAEEEEAEEEEEPKPKKAAKPDENRIPKKRFDEVNARRKAAEEELRQLKAEQAAETDAGKEQYDFDAAEEAYGDLLLSGKTKEALAKRKEIRAAEQAVFVQEAQQNVTTTVDAKSTERELNKLVSLYEGKYDVMNPDSEDFSEDVVDETLAYYRGFLTDPNKSLTHSEAFHLAVDTTVRLYGLEETAATEEPDAKPKPKKVLKKKRSTKKKTALAKKAPKNPTGAAGTAGDAEGTTELDITKMTDEEFDALPESTRAKLRGDVL